MSRSSFLVLALPLWPLLGTSLIAQTFSVDWVAHTSLTVSASGPNALFPKGTPLNAGPTLVAINALQRADAWFRPSLTVAPGSVLARIIETASSVLNGVKVGQHDTLLTIRSSTPVRATVTVTYTAAAGGALVSSQTLAEVDVGNNGKSEFSTSAFGTKRQQFTVTLNQGGLVLRTRTGSSLSPNKAIANIGGSLQILVQPASGCAAGMFGRSCGNGAKPIALSGTTSGRVLNLELQNGRANARGFLVLGGRRQNVRLPGSVCSLLTDIVQVQTFQTDGQGNYRRSASIPATFLGTVYLQQVLAVPVPGGATFESTNGVEVHCR